MPWASGIWGSTVQLLGLVLRVWEMRAHPATRPASQPASHPTYPPTNSTSWLRKKDLGGNSQSTGLSVCRDRCGQVGSTRAGEAGYQSQTGVSLVSTPDPVEPFSEELLQAQTFWGSGHVMRGLEILQPLMTRTFFGLKASAPHAVSTAAARASRSDARSVTGIHAHLSRPNGPRGGGRTDGERTASARETERVSLMWTSRAWAMPGHAWATNRG